MNSKRRPRARHTATPAPAGPAMIVLPDACPACGGTMYRLLDEHSRPRCLDCEPLPVED